MTRLPLFACLALISFAMPMRAQTTGCSGDDYLQSAMVHLESHYRSFPEELFTAQLYVKEGFAQTEVKPDGKWGPKTASSMCSVLKTYTEIGGTDGDWGIHRASHTPQFTAWLLKGARANLSDGAIEFPD